MPLRFGEGAGSADGRRITSVVAEVSESIGVKMSHVLVHEVRQN